MIPPRVPSPHGKTRHEFADELIRFNLTAFPAYLLSVGFPIEAAACVARGCWLWLMVYVQSPLALRWERVKPRIVPFFRIPRLGCLGVQLLFLSAAVRVRDFCKGRKL